jgi:hypothetical protein
MRRNRSHRRQGHCDHDQTVSTVSAGITRIVCERCGLVQVRHHHDLVGVGKIQTNQDVSPAVVR